MKSAESRTISSAWMSFPGLGFIALVDFHLVPRNQAIGFVGHPHYGHQLLELSVGHAFILCGSGMRGNAVITLVRDRHRDVDHLFGERIERSGALILFVVVPG